MPRSLFQVRCSRRSTRTINYQLNVHTVGLAGVLVLNTLSVVYGITEDDVKNAIVICRPSNSYYDSIIVRPVTDPKIGARLVVLNAGRVGHRHLFISWMR